MRGWWAWIVVCGLTLGIAASSPAAVTARIGSIGFGSFIRPDQWVPLTVQIDCPPDATAHAYDLQVVQTDIDGDEVVYTRAGITVNPGQQTFRTYFLPESIDGGLPASGSESAGDVGKRLRVFLYDPATGRRAVRAAVGGQLPQALETGQLTTNTGQKLMLVVGRSPNLNEFNPLTNKLIGLAEPVYFIQIDPNRLPETALAYAAIDGVVWTDADTARLSGPQTAALRNYVEGGGTLAVVQNADPARAAKLADLLPVTVNSSEPWPSNEPLQSIVTPRGTDRPQTPDHVPLDPFRAARPPFRMARAEATPDAIVDAWTDWPDGTHTPLIARRLFGTGCVAWLAEDVSDPALAVVDFGWPRLWGRLLDWHDADVRFAAAETPKTVERLKQRYANDGASRDLGASFVTGTNLEGKTATLLTLAFVFFIGYWVIAGPGAFLYLAAKKRATANWFVYGAVAAAATALTIVIAQVVLRGGPQDKHVSLVRARGDADAARVLSRVGVYLPKDERAELSIPHVPNGPAVSVTPLALDPHFAPGSVNPRDSSYAVPVDLEADATAAQITVPFRSTLKKLQTDWTGPVVNKINGRPRLTGVDAAPLDGRLSNDTGQDLRSVIVVFRRGAQRQGDAVLALPDWKKGQTLDLAATWKGAESKVGALPSGLIGLRLFENNKDVRGQWDQAVTAMYEDFRRSVLNTSTWDDSDRDYFRSFPLVSLFDRCAPMANYNDQGTRVDLLRSGVRTWNVSPAVAAGAMVVLAQADGPLPVPLTVDGDVPSGGGRLFYQAVLPMDRAAVNHPTTEPDDAN